jgi:hypothetical protein
MAATFKVGDRVSWNSEAGRVRGRIVRVHRKDVNYKGFPSREPGRAAVRNQE